MMQALDNPIGLYGRRGVPARNDGAVVIHTGLSVVTSSGYLVSLVRDNSKRVARVEVTHNDQLVATPGVDSDPKVAADMLAARAQRFLGPNWTVVGWQPDQPQQQQQTDNQPPDEYEGVRPTKSAGYISKSMHL